MGGLWVAPFSGKAGQAAGYCLAASPACLYPEDLFSDDVPLKRVESVNALAPGKWFLDYDRSTIYMFDEPTGHSVELSSSRSAFSGSAKGVIVENLIVEKYAVPAQMGAIGGQYPGPGWRVLSSEARLNHGTGIVVGDDAVVQGCSSHDNGQQGIRATGANITVALNNISKNNFAGFDPSWEAGGAKFSYTTNLVVRANKVADNSGVGLWTDIDNVDAVYDGNTVTNNGNEGIKHEISFAATIRNNVVSRNGKDGSVWLWGSQILVQLPER